MASGKVCFTWGNVSQDRALRAALRQPRRNAPAGEKDIPRQAFPFDLDKAREHARQRVADALRKGVPVVHVRVVKQKQGAALVRVMERILPDGRVERLDEAE